MNVEAPKILMENVSDLKSSPYHCMIKSKNKYFMWGSNKYHEISNS